MSLKLALDGATIHGVSQSDNGGRGLENQGDPQCPQKWFSIEGLFQGSIFSMQIKAESSQWKENGREQGKTGETG